MKVKRIAVDKVKVAGRVREDFGDMESLKASIGKYGLLNPIMVDEEMNLIAGARRLRAVQELGQTEIDANVLPQTDRLVRFNMEMQENLVRKDFTESEVDRSIEMKKRLMHRPWWVQLVQFFKRLWQAILSIFRKKEH